MIDFDALLNKLGGFGKYQAIVVPAIYYFGIPSGLNAIASVFLSYSPDFRCAMPPFDNTSLYPDLKDDDILNLTTPLNEKGDPIDSCVKYGYNTTACVADEFNCVNKSDTTVKCHEGYHYDDSLFTETTVTEFDLVCDNQIWQSVTASSYMVGLLFGSLIFGLVSDRFGRRISTLIATVGMLITMLGTTFSATSVQFTVCRLLVGVFSMGNYVSLFVHLMEIVSPKWRTAVGVGFQAGYAVGYMLWSAIAFIWRDWREMQFATFVISSPFLVIALFLPESPRWLFTAGKTENGKKLCKKIAKLNKVEMDDTLWKETEKSETGEQQEKDSEKSFSLIDLFRLPTIRIVTLKVGFNWMVNSMVYYGIALNAGSLAGDIFINNVLAGVFEIASYAFCALTMDYIGRRLLLAITLTGAGFALIASTIVNEYTDGKQSLINLGVAFAFIGKALISGSFAIIYNFTSELYPTVIRTNAVGFGSMIGRIGSILSPFIIGLQDYVSWLPNSIFGALAVIGGLISLTFRDTTGYNMMETIEDAELFHSGKEIIKAGKQEISGHDNPIEIAEITKL